MRPRSECAGTLPSPGRPETESVGVRWKLEGCWTDCDVTWARGLNSLSLSRPGSSPCLRTVARWKTNSLPCHGRRKAARRGSWSRHRCRRKWHRDRRPLEPVDSPTGIDSGPHLPYRISQPRSSSLLVHIWLESQFDQVSAEQVSAEQRRSHYGKQYARRFGDSGPRHQPHTTSRPPHLHSRSDCIWSRCFLGIAQVPDH